MKINKKSSEKNILNFEISVENKELQKAFNKSVETLSINVSVKGFRPGKAPKKLIISNISEAKLKEETVSNALNDTFMQLNKTEKLDPIEYPKIDVKKYTLDFNDPEKVKGELEYSVSVEIMPEAKLKDFKKIKLSKAEPTKPTEKEIDDVLDYLAKQKANFKSIASPAKKGNRVEVNFEGEVNGTKLPEMKSLNHPIILGDNTMIPGFEDKLIGLKAGDEKEFELTFPEQYGKREFAGKKAKFKVEMLLVQEIIMPERNDKLAKDFGHTTFKELKSAIEKNVEDEKIHKNIQKDEEEIVEQLLKLVEVEVPQVLIDREIDHMVEDAKQKVEKYKISFEQYLLQMKKTEQEFRKGMRDQAEKAVKIGFALREVIKKLDIKGEGNKVGAKTMEELFKIAYKNSGRGEYKAHTHNENF